MLLHQLTNKTLMNSEEALARPEAASCIAYSRQLLSAASGGMLPAIKHTSGAQELSLNSLSFISQLTAPASYIAYFRQYATRTSGSRLHVCVCVCARVDTTTPACIPDAGMQALC